MLRVEKPNMMGYILMITTYRAHGFGDGQAKINLIGPDGEPELVWADGMKRNDARRAMRIVTELKALFPSRWMEIHG